MNLSLQKKAAALLIGAAILAQSHPVHAERNETDCGPMEGYQDMAPAPVAGVCSTHIGLSRYNAPASRNTGSPYTWKIDLTAPVKPPAIGGDGSIYFGSGTTLYKYSFTGVRQYAFAASGEIQSTPAIGRDGTAYFGTTAGKFYAVKPDGTVKWQYPASSSIGSVTSSPVIDRHGTVFFGDANGDMQALVDRGTSASLLWKTRFSGALRASPTLSPSGGMVLIGDVTGLVHGLSTADGQPISGGLTLDGAPATIVISSTNNLWIATSAGTLYAGVSTTRVGDVGQPALAPDGGVAVVSSGRLLLIDPKTLATRWSIRLPAGGSVFVGTPVVSADGWVVIGDANGSVYQYRATDGLARPALAVGTGAASGIAITPANGIVVAVGNSLVSYTATTATLASNWAIPLNRVAPFEWERPSALMIPGLETLNGYAPSKPAMQYCDGTTLTYSGNAGKIRPGVSATVVRATTNGSPTDYLTNFAPTDLPPVTLANGTRVPSDCNAHLCTDAEVPLGIAETPYFGNNWGSLLPTVTSDTCDATDAIEGCGAVNSASIDYTTTCNPNVASTCSGANRHCIVTRPQNSGSGDPALEEYHCATIDTSRCAPLPGPAMPDPIRSIRECHELRECARGEDVYSMADVTPVCTRWHDELGKTVTSAAECDLEETPPAPVQTEPIPADIPALDLWQATPNFCVAAQAERGNGGDKSSNGSDSGSKSKKKKWGVGIIADISANANLEPISNGLFAPNIKANGAFGVSAMVMGQPVNVLYAGASASLVGCKTEATSSVILFNQTIASADFAPANYADTDGKCGQAILDAVRIMGRARNALYHTARLETLLHDAIVSGTKIRITKKMCTASGLTAAQCNATLTPALLNDIQNRYNAKYEAFAKLAEYEAFKSAANTAFSPFTTDAVSKGFSKTVGAAGIKKTIEFGGRPDHFSIIGVSAYFPIGPLMLVLDVQGTGSWGIGGGLDYGAQFIPGANDVADPATIWAQAEVVPQASIDVDAFVGVGYDFGIGGAAVGIGSDVQLAFIQAPLKGRIEMNLSNATNFGNLGRRPPTEFSRYDPTPKVMPRTFTWTTAGSMGAAANLHSLKGTADVRLRVRFLFFSKTWKKRMVSFPGFSKTYSFTGSMHKGLPIPGVDLKVGIPMMFPTIGKRPTTGAEAITATQIGGWLDLAAIPSEYTRASATAGAKTFLAHVKQLDKDTSFSKCEPFL